MDPAMEELEMQVWQHYFTCMTECAEEVKMNPWRPKQSRNCNGEG